MTVLASTPVLEGTVNINGIEVTYFDSQTESDRMPVVLLHGTSGSTAIHHSYLFPMLAPRQRVIAIDWAQPHSGTLELADLEAQVVGVLNAVLPERNFALIGYSLGASLAVSIAAHQPDQVHELILINGWMLTDLQQILRNDVWLSMRTTNNPDIAKYTVFCAFGGPFLAQRTEDEMLPAINAVRQSEFIDQQMDLNRRIDVTDEASRITAKTLIVGCTNDQMVPKRHSKALFGAIEDARYTELDAGHAVVFERPAELFQVVEHFLANPGAHPAGSIISTSRP